MTHNESVRVFWLLFAWAISFAACNRAPRSTGPFPGAAVVLISIDTLRADHLAVYGYTNGSTPALDQFAKEAVVFDAAYSHTPLTLPSHASLLTGLLPFHHGVRDNLGFTIPSTASTLAERFKAAGYATGAAVSAYVLRHQTAVARGFDFFDDAIEIAGAGESLSASQRDGRFAVDALASWIERQPGPRVFAFLHLYEPHTPYAPPPNHNLPNAYDGDIAYADELAGHFINRLKARNLFDGAIVAVVSDHGEGLNDHGESEHGIFLYREALHVPWLLRLPHGANGGRRVASVTGTVDVAATLLDLAGLAVQGLDGRPMTPTLNGGTVDARRVYAETEYPRIHFGWSDLAAAIDGQYHYIRAPRPELFDLKSDPGERHNIAGSAASSAAALRDWIAKTAANASPATPAPVTAEGRERLKSLGYIGSSSSTTAGAATVDPKDAIQSYEALKHALDLAAQGRDADAIAELEPITRANPRMLDAWEALAKSRERLDRTKEAVDAFGKVLELDPLKPETHLALARIYALERQPERAREHAMLAVERDPAGANETLAELALDARQLDDASNFARKAAAADPTRYMTQYLLGVVAQLRGRCDEAMDAFQRAIDLKRTEPSAVVRNLHAGLADCLARAGRNADAEREFKEELALVPWSPEARVGLATLYRSLGRDAEARKVLADLVQATPNADASTYWTVVRAFTTLGDADAAREWAARARARFPGDARFK